MAFLSEMAEGMAAIQPVSTAKASPHGSQLSTPFTLPGFKLSTPFTLPGFKLSTLFTLHGFRELTVFALQAFLLSTLFTVPGFTLSTLFTLQGFKVSTLFTVQACLFYTLFLYNPKHCHNATALKKPASASVGRLRISQRRSQTWQTQKTLNS